MNNYNYCSSCKTNPCSCPNNPNNKSNPTNTNNNTPVFKVIANPPFPGQLDCNGCIPQTGELMINGGFEDPQIFFGWQIDPNNDAVDRAAFAHSGQEATRLASSDPKGDPAHDAILFQDVPGICFGKHYELQFEMSGETTRANASVNARVIWLDQNKNILGSGLQITITEDSLPDIKTGAWTTFQGVTNASPPQTQFARVRFEIHGSTGANAVNLDDVSFKPAANG